MPAAPSSSAELLDLIRKSGIVPPDRLAAVIPDPNALPPETQKVAALLVNKGVITRFQAQQLLAGRHKGFRLGAYAVLDQLGRGGMGAVYLAEHTELRRKVAIKVLISAKDDDQKLALERFLREARAAAALDHPNIVRIFDVCRHGEVPYLVMEYVEGETLQQLIDRDGAIPYTTASDYIAQAAAGLQHAHEKGFVHRDIKPGNLMRDKSGSVKILDMGLARSSTNERDKLTERLDHGAVVGTADFIAPEQALNLPQIDIRADIYSLGATFFALITGKPPFEGNTTQKLLHHQMTAAPQLAKIDATLPKGLSAVVAKMLAKKPADRFQTPAELIAALAPWLGNSSRILAGLSRTNLGQGAELHATLHDIARRNSGRLRVTADLVDDSDEVDPSTAARETGAVAVAETTRSESSKPKKEKAKKGKSGFRKELIFAALGLLAPAGAAVGWFAFGHKEEKPKTNPDAVELLPPPATFNPNPNPQPAPKNPAPNTDPKPKDPPPKGLPPAGPLRVIYQLDLTNQKPFNVRGSHESTGQQIGRDVRLVPLEKSGDGDFPAGWSGTPYAADSEAEYWAELRGTRTILGMRNLRAASAMLLSPDMTIPETRCRVRFEYMTEGTGGKIGLLKFKSTERPRSTGLLELFTLPGTGGSWRTVEANVDLRGMANGFFEFHNSDSNSAHGFYLASFEVTEPKPDSDPVLYRLDLTGQKQFAIRSGLKMVGDQKLADVLSRTGIGEPPTGWIARCYNLDSRIEFFADDPRLGQAIGIKNVEGPGSAMLFSPKFDCLGGICRLKFDYSAAVRSGRFAVRFKPNDNRGAWDVAKPQVTGDVWRGEDLIVDLKQASGGVFEFHNSDENKDASLRIRNVVITELPAGTVPPPSGSASPSPGPAGPDLSKLKEVGVVYRFNAATLAPFRVTKEGGTRTSGNPERLPAGVSARCWKATANGEFRLDEVAGAAGLGLTNLSDEMSAQFSFELEKELNLVLQPGKAYRVKVSYLTKNDATGTVVVQTQDYKHVASTKLAGTGGQWQDAAVSFERKDGIPVRLTIDNNAVGEGNTLYFKSIEVVELEPVKK
ncbi:MAG TPA: serine/threonine-protein kinase [Gemmataceae bacterium]|nr:serine/threonine-protein kinase [Gemmataceae bacterium]